MARTHGTEGTYQWGCRLECCRAAHRRYKAIRQGRDPDATKPRAYRLPSGLDERHGKVTHLELIRQRVAQRSPSADPVDQDELKAILGL